MAHNIPDYDEGAPAARTPTTDDHSTKETLIGTDRRGRASNVSWGAIFAGVVTFLAVTVLMGLIAAGMGLEGAGTAAGVWSVITLIVALAAAGYVAGALAVRSGLLHGFLTWATSLVVGLVLAAWLSTSLLVAAGGVLGQVATTAAEVVPGANLEQVIEDAQEAIDQDDIAQAEEALDQAQQQVADAADTAATGVWWVFAGMLIGAMIAAVMGMVGARSVITRDDPIGNRRR